MIGVLTEQDFDAIERVACPMDELLPAPYDNPHMTARMRCSMLSVRMKAIPLLLLDLRMEKYYAFPAFKIS